MDVIFPRILMEGTFKPDNIVVSFSKHSNRKIDSPTEEQVDILWEGLMERAPREGMRLWNGRVCRVNALALSLRGELKIELAPIEFKTRECFIDVPEASFLSEEHYPKGAAVSSLCRTADDHYVFVKLSGKSNNNYKIDVLGGILGDHAEVLTSQDLFIELYKEIEEEASIPRENIKKCTLELILLDPRGNIGFCFGVLLSDTKEVIKKRFKEENVDVDIDDLLFVPAREVEERLARMGNYKPLLIPMLPIS